MEIIADLHLHGKYSQATSKSLEIPNLEKYARMKGVELLGTGDFTHPKWIEHIKANLSDEGNGIYKTKTGFPFMLTTELSLIYSQGGKGRRVHNVVLAPDLDAVKGITDYLLSKGRIDYDGRPIFKIPCPEFVEELRKVDERVEVIPAHIWTPWFSMLGSKSGFDTVKECFQDQTKYINALETGLSSDPPLNWRLSQLDNYDLVSFSDLHSFWPWRIGREATLFDLKELSYKNILDSIRKKKVAGTIEVDPNYGKYHIDGHRKCNFCSEPNKTKELNGVCPVCGKSLTIGVLNRVEELADRKEGYKPENAKKFHTLIPLSEILSFHLKKAVATKTVWGAYGNLVNDSRSEFDILLRTPEEELKRITDEKIVESIMLNREGKIKVKPGYDGEYGVPLLPGVEVKEEVNISVPKKMQKTLGDF